MSSKRTYPTKRPVDEKSEDVLGEHCASDRYRVYQANRSREREEQREKDQAHIPIRLIT